MCVINGDGFKMLIKWSKSVIAAWSVYNDIESTLTSSQKVIMQSTQICSQKHKMSLL